ncbi:MAG: methyltransferase domain-containing protein [Chloroflexota bacterium]
MDQIKTSSRGLYKFLYWLLPIPLHTFYPLRQEVYLALIRLTGFWQKRKFRKKDALFVNLGAGSAGRSGWVNVDMLPLAGINCLYDCRKSLPFQNQSVSGIFCEHFLEHLDYTEEVPFFLSECRRVLKEGAILRIIVPDAEKYLNAYTDQGWGNLASIRPLTNGEVDAHYQFKYRTKMELINMVFRQGHRHKYAYDFETLRFVLLRYGFSQVLHQDFTKSALPTLAIDSETRASESLYVEAVK